MRKTGCMRAARCFFAPKWKGKVNPMESSNQFLDTERIGKLMQKYAIPCIISLLVGALYNIVDQIFIANASYLGSYGNAANTVVFPLTVVALAIAVMIGDGCCAFVSISLGQNEVPKAKRSVGNAVVMCLVSSIVLAALYLIFEDTISKVKKTGELETTLKVILDSIDASSNMWTRTDPRHIHSQIDVNIERDRPQILGYLTSIDNSLAILRPDVASKWDYVKNQDLTPDMFTVSSNEIVWWKCPDCGREWKCSINSMTRKGRFGCAECSKKHRGKSFTQGVVKKVGSLAETMPELSKEWHPTKNGDLTPNDITAGKFKPVWWLCPKCGYEWQASPNNRKRGIGCPCCSGRVPKTGINDLATLYPELLNEWDYERNTELDPRKVLPKSGKHAWWVCSVCGNHWESEIRSRVNGHGCPQCGKRRKK